MEQLKQVWVYRFWIVIGIVTCMPIIGYFVNTSSLAKSANSKKLEREGKVKKWDAVAKAINPNDEWTKKTNELKDELNTEVDGAWVKLFERQVQFMNWPVDKKGRADVQGSFEKWRAKGEQVPVATLVAYRDLYSAHLQSVLARAQPVDPPGSKGLVEIDSKVIDEFRPTWTDPDADPPQPSEVWLAQEDIWILRALMGVIAESNKESTKLQESAVKLISDIRIGAGKGSLDDSVTKASKEQPFAASFGPPAAGGATAGAGAQGGGRLRYIGSPENKLFRQMPVYMQLIVDQREIPSILAKFAECEIPMLVTKMEIAQASGSQPVKSGTSSGERAPSKEGDAFHRTQLDVWARAYLYDKPDSLKTAEKAPSETASPTPADAKP